MSAAAGPMPRVVHYCWFGRGPKPGLAVKCMNSWRKHLRGWQFVEWNEDRFDVRSVPYVREAYEAGKYAFVSDYVRLHALYHHGGVYMDTDVEVLKPLEPLLAHGAFSGFEDERFLQSGTMGAVPGHPWIKSLLDDYEGRRFVKDDGSYDLMTNTAAISAICKRMGLKLDGRYQELDSGAVFYPRTYFSPYDPVDGASYINGDSYTIHHYSQSWLPAHVRLRSRLKRAASRIVGPKAISALRERFKP